MVHLVVRLCRLVHLLVHMKLSNYAMVLGELGHYEETIPLLREAVVMVVDDDTSLPAATAGALVAALDVLGEAIARTAEEQSVSSLFY